MLTRPSKAARAKEVKEVKAEERLTAPEQQAVVQSWVSIRFMPAKMLGSPQFGEFSAGPGPPIAFISSRVG